jgi:hypothetical protein
LLRQTWLTLALGAILKLSLLLGEADAASFFLAFGITVLFLLAFVPSETRWTLVGLGHADSLLGEGVVEVVEVALIHGGIARAFEELKGGLIAGGNNRRNGL